MICNICDAERKNKHALSQHIRQAHKMTRREYYDTYLKRGNEGICPTCGKETGFLGLNGYYTFCSPKCHRPSPREVTCKVCGKIWLTTQVNPHQVPICCPDCKLEIRAIKVANSIEKVKLGHKKQGLAIQGDNNPAKRPDVRKKISKGVTDSYTPELRDLRSRQWASLGVGKHCDGRGNLLRSALELSVAQLLQKMDLDYEYERRLEIEGKRFYPDFTLPNGTIVEVVGYLLEKQNIRSYKRKFRHILKHSAIPLVIVTYTNSAVAFRDLCDIGHCDIVTLNNKEPKMATVRLRDLDIIDYAHALPFHDGKCSRVHAHSSLLVSVEVTGYVDPTDYMVVDFGVVKKEAKKIIEEFDHKLVIGKKYVQGINGKQATISYTTVGGEHQLSLPVDEVAILDDEPTIEYMAELVARKLIRQLPPNICFVAVELSEGIGKSAIYGVGECAMYSQLSSLERILKFHEENPDIEWIPFNTDEGNHFDFGPKQQYEAIP